MNEFLQARIQNMMEPASPMGFQEGGMVDDAMMDMPEEVMAPSPDDERLRQTVNELMMARDTAEDPIEAAQASKMIESSEIAQKSPMAQIASEVAAAGRGQDTTLAHLTPGEVVLPPEMMESDEFERAVESRFEELNLDPAKYVVGMGIASLNPVTGLEEFGFFKKIGKSIKKFAKKIAPVAGPLANFIPGVGPVLAGVIGAATNVAGGKGLSGAITGALGGYGAGKGIASLATKGGFSSIGTAATPFKDLGFLDKLGFAGKGALKGIGGLLGLGGGQTSGFSPEQLEALSDQDKLIAIQKQVQAGTLDPNKVAEVMQSLGGQATPTQLFDALIDPKSPGITPFDPNNPLANILSVTGQGDGQNQNILQKIGGALGIGSGEGQIPFGRAAGIGGIAALLGKLAFDEAKNRKGVPLTPMTQLDAMGRFNIEAEIARRMGKEQPNPVEFGLLPRNILPQLAAGKPRPERNVPEVGMDAPPVFKALPRGADPIDDIRYTSADRLNQVPQVMMRGGPVMAYAKGGNVAAEEFKRMNGKIDGPGTETSDDIPAMLSDGEFVMKSQAVRGAGAFDMKKRKGGIVELRPTREEDRERGTKLMYDMMDLFAGKAKASA